MPNDDYNSKLMIKTNIIQYWKWVPENTQIQTFHHEFGKISFKFNLKIKYIFARGAARPLMEPVSHMTKYNSYSIYMQKGSTNWGIKFFFDSWECHSKLKTTLRKECLKVSVVFFYTNSMTASKKSMYLISIT